MNRKMQLHEKHCLLGNESKIEKHNVKPIKNAFDITDIVLNQTVFIGNVSLIKLTLMLIVLIYFYNIRLYYWQEFYVILIWYQGDPITYEWVLLMLLYNECGIFSQPNNTLFFIRSLTINDICNVWYIYNFEYIWPCEYEIWIS